ncbi:MAG: SGNH/GDSL hydrolase family protein [Candidatus Bathyarchaeia archaeon]
MRRRHRQRVAYHPVIGWWFIQNLKGMVPHEGGPYLLQTNSLGMRSDREYSTARENGRHRIVLLGDSYIAGDGVENSARFCDLLEKSYPNLDVLNFGLPGSGTDQQLLVYETLAKPFEADVYILAVYVGDIQRVQLDVLPTREPGTNTIWYRPKPYFTLETGRLVIHNQPVPNEPISEQEAFKRGGFLRLLALRTSLIMPEWMRRSNTVQRISFALGRPFNGYDDEKSAGWQLLRAIIERFIDQVRGKIVFIFPLPNPYHFIGNLSPTYMERFSALQNPAESCFVLDLLPYFKHLSRSDQKKCCFPADWHYTPFGHRVIAKCISDALTAHCPDILT